MNLLGHPELIDSLSASYALGTLRGGARRRLETLARVHPSIHSAILLWQERLAPMAELSAPVLPSPRVWKKIENIIGAEQAASAPAFPNPPPASTWGLRILDWLFTPSRLGRGAALGGYGAAVAALGLALNLHHELGARDEQLALAQAQTAIATARLSATPDVRYVAVLLDAHAAASMLATFDAASQTMTIRHVDGFELASNASLQLWALPPSGRPVSLGVLGARLEARMPMDHHRPEDMPMLAVSLEPLGGVPGAGGPTGPVLFKGRLLRSTT
jgi:anti-sigma-K factor RskA